MGVFTGRGYEDVLDVATRKVMRTFAGSGLNSRKTRAQRARMPDSCKLVSRVYYSAISQAKMII